jgi:hypothetical protein
LLALKTDRKTSPETRFDPVVPMTVTLMSRPDTPRRERSSLESDPTFVLESEPRIVDSCDHVYVPVFHVASGAAASYEAPLGVRSDDPLR